MDFKGTRVSAGPFRGGFSILLSVSIETTPHSLHQSCSQFAALTPLIKKNVNGGAIFLASTLFQAPPLPNAAALKYVPIPNIAFLLPTLHLSQIWLLSPVFMCSVVCLLYLIFTSVLCLRTSPSSPSCSSSVAFEKGC